MVSELSSNLTVWVEVEQKDVMGPLVATPEPDLTRLVDPDRNPGDA